MGCDFAQLPVMELLTLLWNSATTHVGYIYVEENLRALKTELEDLKALKMDVEMAHAQNKQQRNQMLGWLERVDNMVREAAALTEHGNQEIQNTCFGGYCPKNCCTSYKMGKKIEMMRKELKEETEKGQKFNLEEDTILKFWRTFREEVATIGLFGPGGVGKTTLMNKISNDLLDSQRQQQQQQQPFDLVIWSDVSQDLNHEKILGDIAREIGFLEDRWKDKSHDEKVAQIGNILREKKFVLLLDDVWKPVDLAQVGVPPPSENGSKVVFTTRAEEVCSQMGAEESINVGCMKWENAWKLFQDKVGEDLLNAHQDIPKLAETIARMCNGLPLALITVARAMSSKETVEEWHHSVKVLMKSTSEISGMENQVFPLLKFSYDSLPTETVKSCLLYCTLFPEDYSINKCNLIDYWIGEGFLGSRTEGHEIITILVNACLLEDEGREVKMHDLIREVALWIASNGGRVKNKYLVEAGAQLTEAPELGKWEGLRRMSLMANKIQNLTKSPRSQDLLTLLVAVNNLKMIANTFFRWMPSLKVVDLSENRELTYLPSGFSKLDSLQYLNLSRTGIKELPIELRNLVNLKCLNLEYTYDLHTIQLLVLSSFSKLVVLRMLHCSSSDRVVGDGILTGGPESLARDLQSLQQLNVLTLTVRSKYALKIFLSFSMFQACTQALCLNNFKHSRSIDISFLEGMHCLTELEFLDCINLGELRIEGERKRCFDTLRRVSIVNCKKLADLTWIAFAPNVEFLMVSRCSDMEEIISQSEENAVLFEKLEVLRLVSLPVLKAIYPIPLSFPCLKEIMVDDCPNLKKLPLDSESAKKQRIVIQGWEDWWTRLEWENEAARNAFLHSFKACMY